jgi:hypothetical protein
MPPGQRMRRFFRPYRCVCTHARGCLHLFLVQVLKVVLTLVVLFKWLGSSMDFAVFFKWLRSSMDFALVFLFKWLRSSMGFVDTGGKFLLFLLLFYLFS